MAGVPHSSLELDPLSSRAELEVGIRAVCRDLLPGWKGLADDAIEVRRSVRVAGRGPGWQGRAAS